MGFVADNPCVGYREYQLSSGINRSVDMSDDVGYTDSVEIKQFAEDPHTVKVVNVTSDDVISVSIHKGTFVQGFYKAIVEMGHEDYLKELMGIALKA